MIDLKQFRKINNLTQEQAGNYFGCTQAFVSQIELKKRPVPDYFISIIEADSMVVKPANLPDKSLILSPGQEAPDANLELEKAYWEIESLQKRIEKQQEDYSKTIDELRGENKELIRENGSLENQVSTLNRELNQYRGNKTE